MLRLAPKVNNYQLCKVDRKKLTKAEIDRLLEIEADCFADGMAWDRAIFKASLEEDVEILIVKIQDKIVGSLFYEKNANHFYIWSIGVGKDFQRAGVGTILIKHVMEEALKVNKPITLSAPPRNQLYYERFGFQVKRDYPGAEFVVKDDKQLKYPLYKLSMKIDCKAIQKHLDGVPQNPAVTLKPITVDEKNEWRCTIEGIAAIKAVRELAVKAKGSTSFWYSFWGRSRQKEMAFKAIEQELTIQLSSIKQKTMLDEKGLALIVKNIFRNAMIVRGYGTQSTKTTSAMALIEYLTADKNKILPAVKIINELLKKYYFDINNYKDNYEGLRKILIPDDHYRSTKGMSNYRYYF